VRYGICSLEKYSFVIFFKVPVRKITPMRFGIVMRLNAISPKFQTNVMGKIAPIKLKNTYAQRYGLMARGPTRYSMERSP